MALSMCGALEEEEWQESETEGDGGAQQQNQTAMATANNETATETQENSGNNESETTEQRAARLERERVERDRTRRERDEKFAQEKVEFHKIASKIVDIIRVRGELEYERALEGKLAVASKALNAVSEYDETALYFAARHGAVGVLEQMLAIEFLEVDAINRAPMYEDSERLALDRAVVKRVLKQVSTSNGNGVNVTSSSKSNSKNTRESHATHSYTLAPQNPSDRAKQQDTGNFTRVRILSAYGNGNRRNNHYHYSQRSQKLKGVNVKLHSPLYWAIRHAGDAANGKECAAWEKVAAKMLSIVLKQLEQK